MSNAVFVLDTKKQPLSPCTPGMARSLLKAGKAAVFRQYPFTIILKKTVNSKEINPCQLKLDPGSKTTGIAILQDKKLIWAAELTHRGQQIKNDLESRRSLRRSRRGRKTRYRQPRFLNRTRDQEWLPPSLEHRVQTTMTWVKRLIKLCPINSIATELVKFDTQKLEILTTQPLLIKCAGHGNRQVIHVDKFGFPRRNKSGELVRKSALVKQVKGFQTGDIVKAVITKGKKIGSYLGKVAVRSCGSFNIKTVTQTVQGISHKYCQQVHRKDGYVYGF